MQICLLRLVIKNTTGVVESAFWHSTFYANIGYAFIISKYYLPSGTSGDPKNGIDWQLGYDWVSRSSFGVMIDVFGV